MAGTGCLEHAASNFHLVLKIRGGGAVFVRSPFALRSSPKVLAQPLFPEGVGADAQRPGASRVGDVQGEAPVC